MLSYDSATTQAFHRERRTRAFVRKVSREVPSSDDKKASAADCPVKNPPPLVPAILPPPPPPLCEIRYLYAVSASAMRRDTPFFVT